MVDTNYIFTFLTDAETKGKDSARLLLEEDEVRYLKDLCYDVSIDYQTLYLYQWNIKYIKFVPYIVTFR